MLHHLHCTYRHWESIMLETYTSGNQKKTYKVCTCGKCKGKIACEGKLCRTMVSECGFTQIASALVVNVVRMRLNVMGFLTSSSIPLLVHSMLYHMRQNPLQEHHEPVSLCIPSLAVPPVTLLVYFNASPADGLAWD